MGKQEERVELVLLMLLVLLCVSEAVTKAQKQELREKVKEMFNHAYQSYMKYAYPADELMPLSCKGRYRGSEPSRGDIDDALGNFSLTLVDTLDSLVVLGELEEFEKAVRLVIRDVSLDQDIVVSVFETNIRMLGGLLGGHVLAKYLKLKKKALLWYQDELLEKARELGIRLLPAFNTTTGIPFPRVNLRHGINQGISRTGTERDTCTSCAGTMILEFAALTRLTGDPIFETKARRAMDILWKQRHRGSDLVGTVINIHNGDWVRRESGVGAGVDSYYEYLLKAYILLGDDTYLDRFNKHYQAIGKYVKQGPMLVDVHMHRPLTNSRNFMDALLAFWPGLQVLKGDIKPAIETHEMLYQVTQRHNFLPEAFTTDFRVHWGQHPLRPEFVESTYFIYKATGDPYYLDVGKTVLEKLEKHARVKCGYASIKDVTTSSHEDQMDSFVLSETFKYLYLLFSEREDLVLDVDDYIFTTEAHLLPLSLSLFSKNITDKEMRKVSFKEDDEDEDDNHDRVCPNTNYLFPGQANYAHNVRSPLKDYVDNLCPGPKKPRRKPRLRAVEFIAGNKQQLEQLRRMGIQLVTMQDGRVQLLHTASEASSAEDAEDGMLFMQDMIELSKQQQQEVQQEPRVVQFVSTPFFGQVILNAGHAQFGLDLKGREGVQGKLAVTEPLKACSRVLNPEVIWRKIAIVERGECMFIDKARHVQSAGAIGAIILDNTEGSSSETHPLFAMSGDGKDDVTIPVVFVFSKEGQRLLEAMQDRPHLEVLLGFQAKRSEVIMKEMLQQQKKAEGETEGMKPAEPSIDNLYTEGSQGDSSPAAKEDSRTAQDLLSSAEKTVTAGAELSEEETAALMNKYLAKIQDHNSRSQPQTPHTKDRETLWQILDGSRDSVQIKDHLNQLATGEGSSKVSRVFKGILRLLASHTNFNQLSNLEEYKRAIGKLVEAAFSHGQQKLDIGELELINQMKLELKAFSDKEELKEEFKEKLKSDMSDGKTCDKSTPGQTDQPTDSGDNFKSYAGKDDFEEPLMPETPSGGTSTEEHSQTHTHYREHVSSSVSEADPLTPDSSDDSDISSATGANPYLNSGSQEPQCDTSSPSSRTSNTGNSENEARPTKYLEDQQVDEELGKVDALIRDVFVDSVEVENEDKTNTQEDWEL